MYYALLKDILNKKLRKIRDVPLQHYKIGDLYGNTSLLTVNIAARYFEFISIGILNVLNETS